MVGDRETPQTRAAVKSRARNLRDASADHDVRQTRAVFENARTDTRDMIRDYKATQSCASIKHIIISQRCDITRNVNLLQRGAISKRITWNLCNATTNHDVRKPRATTEHRRSKARNMIRDYKVT